jgi:trehalose 6-phosphate synthase/phosphatase
MNLVAKEYVACKRDEPGALILSEFAGAAEELFNALVVNPYDARIVAECLSRALKMSDEEKRARMGAMRRRVMAADARRWAASFLDDLAAPSTAAPEAGSADEAKRRLSEAVSRGGRVLLMLDYDGTLREIERDPAAAVPNPAVKALLGRLRDCKNVEVTIISGRTPQDLESFLGDHPFTLVAEHGASIRRAGGLEWEQLDRTVDYAWKDEVRRLFKLYEASTPGAFVEEKRSSLVWHYRQADPDFGSWKARLLAAGLSSMVANLPVVVRHGKKIVEVTATQVNKGAAVARLLEDARYDLVLIAGDDATDEMMFQLDLPRRLSIKIGDGDTHAQYRVATPAAFRRLLESAVVGRRGDAASSE